MSRTQKIREIENLIDQQGRPPKLVGNIRIEDGAFVYEIEQAHPELPGDMIVEICESREDVKFFDQNREAIKKELERYRQLYKLEKQTGGKHELADLDL